MNDTIAQAKVWTGVATLFAIVMLGLLAWQAVNAVAHLSSDDCVVRTERDQSGEVVHVDRTCL